MTHDIVKDEKNSNEDQWKCFYGTNVDKSKCRILSLQIY